jgi:hypothetical protein
LAIQSLSEIQYVFKKLTSNSEKTMPISEETPKPFILDLVGPFIFQFKRGDEKKKIPGRAIIYAPQCDGHYANILTDSNDISLPGLPAPGRGKGYIYEFDKDSPVGACKCDCENEKEVLLLRQLKESSIVAKASDYHLQLHIPCPDCIVPLRPEIVWIHQNEASTWVTNPDSNDKCVVNSKRARGLRFVYEKCWKQPKLHSRESPDGKNVPVYDTSYCADVRGNLIRKVLPHYTMTLRFASTHAALGGQLDAYQCFQTMRTLLPDSKNWRVDYDQPDPGIPLDNLSGHHPSDCGAAVMVLRDW